MLHRVLVGVLTSVVAIGCSPQAPQIEPSNFEAGVDDAGAPDSAARAHPCVSTFGSALTTAFGRIDGELIAVVRPSDTGCARFNADHLVLEVAMHGDVYRMVVNIVSDGRDGTDSRIRFGTTRRDLPAPAWSEGWHPNLSLDYTTDLGVHSSTVTFAPFTMGELLDRVAPLLEVGEPISVYATSENRPSSAHLVHRNGRGDDGAIVVRPVEDPELLMFHFDGQTF
ncbi:MAG: hypothetical protein HYV07_25740 [Deltaproteobacteria bacterium]|nr:hypothetical protein [Deltaproteobacteria bacterium]